VPITVSRLKAIWPWLVQARYIWITAAIICVALIISLRLHPTEQVIRLTGLVLQLFGICTVIWGISETRALFGLPSVASKTKVWLNSFPLLRRNVRLNVGNATIPITSSKVRLYGTHGPGATPTIDSRLDDLEKAVISIHERISQTQKEMDEEFQRTAGALKHEEQLRQAEDSTIRAKLEVTGTGGLHISAIGALLLMVGTILSTASNELPELLK